MADIPLAPPTPSSSTAATPSASSATTAVQVSVATLPSSIENLARALQLNATPVVVSDANLVLSTSMGNVVVSLASYLATAEKQTLTKQLLLFSQAQKPLPLTIQPGSPPTQGVLLVPTPPAITQNVRAAVSEARGDRQAPPIAPGNDFRAIVLPALPPPPAILADEQTQSMLASLRQLKPPALENLTIPLPQARDFETPTQAPPLPPTPRGEEQAIASPRGPALPRQADPQASLQRAAQTAPQAEAPKQEADAPKQPWASQGFRAAEPPQAPLSQKPAMAPYRLSVLSLQETPAPPTVQVRTPDIQAQAAPPATDILAKVPPEAQNVQVQPQAIPARTETPRLRPAPVDVFASAPSAVSLLTEGTEVSIHVVSIALPQTLRQQAASALSVPPPELAPNQISATVCGTGANGQLVLKAGDATLFIKAQVSAPVGTTLVLSVDKARDEPPVTLKSPDLNFQALPQALAALERLSPHIFHNVVSNFLPQPTDALSGALMLLLGAFKKGSLESWLGNTAIDTLNSAGEADIVGHLSKELNAAGQPSHDPVVGEWHSYPIPLFAQKQFENLTLYVHSDRDSQKDSSSGARTPGKIRFLIDMRLSRLGSMQIDGFVQQKKLDMILRSEASLPEGLHNELRSSYIKALDAVGYAGTLSFQVGRHHWMVMRKDTPKGIVT
ncbi:MAG: hypothetical protein PHE27_02695 [Alphaproteobacteria bacterium]|nr:hypothetical protein [Alphaproteobacteria bacterium]